jgi:hypothetical protein
MTGPKEKKKEKKKRPQQGAQKKPTANRPFSFLKKTPVFCRGATKVRDKRTIKLA